MLQSHISSMTVFFVVSQRYVPYESWVHGDQINCKKSVFVTVACLFKCHFLLMMYCRSMQSSSTDGDIGSAGEATCPVCVATPLTLMTPATAL